MTKLLFALLCSILLAGCYSSRGHRQDGWDDEDAVGAEQDAVGDAPEMRPEVQPDPQPDEVEESVDIPGDVPSEQDAPDAAELPPVLVWVSIPSGSFEMGCSPGDTYCDIDEEPRHTVNVSAFQMTETEITQEQYEAVMGVTPSYFTSCGPTCPVEQVDWYQAKAFCEAIGARLPSEAEWEYAARAGTSTRYFCGDDPGCLYLIAWYGVNSGGTPHTVGGKPANAFGLYDMHGNLWEWVQDCWHNNYIGAPSTGEVWSGGDCSQRVIRGGSWDTDAAATRVSTRLLQPPLFRNGEYGFRCAQ